MNEHPQLDSQPTLFGHPTGLFVLFFAELWERFSYYGMRALLVFYMIKGFMGCSDAMAYKIYGAYTALVYMTPFFGGMIADRLIGARRAVILGGLFMAAGHLLMGFDQDWKLLGLTVTAKTSFFGALALLIVGNGFFKPNISTIVGSLYPPGSRKRDGGFTIFYIGINLGAAIAPLLCGYVGETYGWHKGFGLATIGMLTGLAVFIAPTLISQVLLLVSCLAASMNIVGIDSTLNFFRIPVEGSLSAYDGWLEPITGISMVLAGLIAFVSLNRRQASNNLSSSRVADLMTGLLIVVGALGFSGAMFNFFPNEFFTKFLFYLLAVILLVAAGISAYAVSRSGLPVWAGLPRDFEAMRTPVLGIGKDWWVYLGALISVPVFMILVSGAEVIVPKQSGGFNLIPEEYIAELKKSELPLMEVVVSVVGKASTPAGLILLLAGLFAVGYLVKEMFGLEKIPRQRMYVVMILTFFSVLFWSFFEQAGSSLNNFTDRNIQRVAGTDRKITEDDIGQSQRLRIPLAVVDQRNPELADLPILSQEFLGRTNKNPAMADLIGRAVIAGERDKPKGKTGAELQALIAGCTSGPLNFSALNYLREYARPGDPSVPDADLEIEWIFAEDNVGLALGGTEIPASVFQSLNPLFILIFGLLFTVAWGWLSTRGLEPSTPVKFALGLMQLGLGFGCFWLGAQLGTDQGMVWVVWLVLGYLLHTTGELCLSPVGLSMVTKLSPIRLVSTVMGTWFLATAFAQFLAAIIASFTSASGDADEMEIIPVPQETVTLYQDVFLFITVAAVVSGIICLVLSPQLKKWMHEDEDE